MQLHELIEAVEKLIFDSWRAPQIGSSIFQQLEYSVHISLTNCVLELKEQEPIVKNSRCVIEYAIWGCLFHNLTCL